MSPRPAPGGLRVVLSPEGLRLPVAAATVRGACTTVLAARRVRVALVSITLLTPRRIAALNRRHLGHAGPTDVISFGFRDPGGALVGDIYLCPAVALRNARRFRVRAREEILRLVVHGTLHVLGEDHPEGADREGSAMWKAQERLLRKVLAS